MAKIFISYSKKDEEIVLRFAELLKNYGNEILMDNNLLNPGNSMQKSLMTGLKEADGTIAFLTKAGIKSQHVTSEVGIARSYMDSQNKFFIPLVEGNVELPYIIKDLTYIQIEKRDIQSIAEEINKLINEKVYPDPPTKETYNANANLRHANPSVASSKFSEVIAEESHNDNLQTNENNKNSYWLLKLNDTSWPLTDFQIGYAAYFNSNHHFGQTTEDYVLFKKIGVGDQIIGYAYEHINAIVCIFKVTESLHQDKQSGELINLTVTRIFKPPIDLSLFISKISFVQELNPPIVNKLISISENNFNEIIPAISISESPPYYNKSSLSEIFTDSSSVEIKDELDFESDVNALAAVVAYKKVEPPLAIGLFGNWGSGKSFFMNKLEKQIKILAAIKNEFYCKEVVHVKFNSWHYSDSNLWASLITKIFGDLQKYKRDDQSGLNTLIKNLNSTKELIADSEIKLERIKKEKDELVEKKTKTETEINEKTGKLESLKFKDIAGIVWNNEAVISNVAEVKKLLPDTAIGNIAIVRTKINELSSFGNKIFESVRILYEFRRGKKPVALLAAFVVFTLSCFMILKYQDKSLSLLNWFTIKSAAYVTALTQFVAFLLPVMGKVNTAYKNLKSLETSYIELEEKERALQCQELVTVTNELEAKKTQLKKQEDDINSLVYVQQQLNNDIDEIIEGKKLNRFIESKVTDKRYIDSLGIISWIRKDFEELDFLLKMQNEITDDKIDELGKKKVENIFKIDRIILYIDDLDRCNQEIVVRVLEAIHLLLAFPLFVVVVGVDPRWMNNALSLKYKDLLNISNKDQKPYTDKNKNLDDETESAQDNSEEGTMNSATSYDYLEKIFQVPFVLKPIDDTSKDKLIESKFEIKTKEKPVDEKNKDQNTNSKNPVENIEVEKQNARENPTDRHLDVSRPEQITTPISKVQMAELLEISAGEVHFMQDISFLIGDTPRTINRYINIYRIIRTHTNFKFLDNNELQHYCTAMFLLGLITGFPQDAKYIFEKIVSSPDSDDKKTIRDFIVEKQISDIPNKTLLKKISQALTIKIEKHEFGDIDLIKFKININLISRFSFRSLNLT